MELFAIVLSGPVALVVCLSYCLILAKAVARFASLSRWLVRLSLVVLGWGLVEALMLLAFGAVGSRRMLGPGFYVAHVLFFFLGTPALANVLVLGRRRLVRWWYLVAALCAAFAVGLVVLQYGVSEALYGSTARVDRSGRRSTTSEDARCGRTTGCS